MCSALNPLQRAREHFNSNAADTDVGDVRLSVGYG